MHKKLTLILIAIVFGTILISSYEHGPAYEGNLNRTGSLGGPANCAGSGCHSDNQVTTIVAVVVKDASGAAVTSYSPGASYTVTVNGSNSSSVTLAKFGFQVSAVLADFTQAGTFTALSGTNVRVVPLSGGILIAEHKKPLNGSSNTYTVTFNWTAPAAGSGAVSFHGILNAVSGDDDGDGDGDRHSGSKTTDDGDDDDDDDDMGDSYPNVAPIVTLTEGQSSTHTAVASVVSASPVVNCYPNPFTSSVNLKIDNGVGTNEVAMYDMSGRVVLTKKIVLSGGNNGATISTEQLPAGRYLIKVNNNGKQTVLPVVKQ